MTTITPSQLIVPQCKGCLLPDFSTGPCTAFDDPEYQHRGGRRCWGRCEDAAEMAGRLGAIAAYAETRAECESTVWQLRGEAEYWWRMAMRVQQQ